MSDPRNGEARDVFVSYRHGDPTRSWVRNQLVPALEADGMSVILDQRDFVQGESLIDQMEAAADRTRVTVAVVDERYRDSDFTMFEFTVSSRLIVVVRGELNHERVPSAQTRIDLGDSDDVGPVVDAVNRVLKRVFVLEADDDESWVSSVLVPELERAGVSTQQASALAGMVAMTAFEQAVQRADKVVVVLSSAYYRDLADENTVVARAGRVVGDVVIQKKVIPVRRDPGEFNIESRYTRDLIIDATNDELWDDAIAAICRLLDVETPGRLPLPPCPYPGMQPFRQADHGVFFGRRTLVEEVHERLRAFRFATVIGPSGSGKSSLVLAGVLPGIGASARGDVRHQHTAEMRVGGDPTAQLNEVLDRLRKGSPEDGTATTARAGRRLLVIDQFEELYALETGAVRRFLDSLDRALDDESLSVIVTVRADFTGSLMDPPSMWTRRFAPSRVEVTPLTDSHLREAIVEPARQRGVGVSPALVERLVSETDGEPGLLPFLQVALRRTWGEMQVRYMTLDAYERSGAERGRSGIRQAISKQAEDAFAQAKVEVGDELGELLVRRMLLRLIQVGQGGRTTRRQLTRDALLQVSDQRDDAETALDVLGRYRIVTTDDPLGPNPERAVAVVDLAHEAIIDGWPTLAQWIEQYSALEVSGRTWSERASEFAGDQGSLLTGRDLERAEDWVSQAEASFLVDPHVRDYVEVSRQESDSREHARMRTRRRIRVGGGVLGASLLVFAIVSLVLWQSAARAQERAEQEADQRVATQLRTSAAAFSGGLALQALLVRAADVIDDSSRMSPIEMLVTAERVPPIAARIDAIERGVGFESALLLEDGRIVIGDGLGEVTVRRPHAGGGDATVDDVVQLRRTILALEPLGNTTIVAAAGGNATPSADASFDYSNGGIDLLDIASSPIHRTPVPLGSDLPVSSLAFRDGLLVAGNWGGEVVVIDVSDPSDPGPPRPLAFPAASPTSECEATAEDRSVRSVAIDDRGRWLAAGLTNCQIAIWDWPSLTPAFSIGEHRDQVRAIEFVPGTAELVSTGNDRSIRSTDLDAAGPSSRLLVESAGGHTSATGEIGEGRVTALCVQPDGSAVMTGGRDHLVRQWIRKEDGRLDPDLTRLASHSTTVRSLQCLGDRQVLSTAGDGVVQWNLAERARTGSLREGTAVSDVAVRPGTKNEVVTVDDGSITFADEARNSLLPPEIDELTAKVVEYSSDGSHLAVIGERRGGHPDRLVVLDADTLAVEVVADSTGEGRLWSVDVTDDGRAIAGMNEGQILLADGERSIVVPTGRSVKAIELSADGHVLAGDSGGSLMCGTADGEFTKVELGRQINDIAIDGQSGTVVVGTADGLLQAYPRALAASDPSACDAADWARSNFPIPHDEITSVDLAIDGDVLVAANSDGNVEIWDVPRTRLIGSLTLPDGDAAEHVAIDPDAGTLAIGGEGATVVFEIDREGLRQRLCEIAQRNLTAEEEEVFLADPDYYEAAKCSD